MDEKSRPSKGLSFNAGAWIVLLIIGILMGVTLAPYVEPFTNPSRVAAMERQEALMTQNQLLKEQVDCLVNGIQLNQGKATLTNCA
ncbi:MAG: hypothetical protein AABW68_03395 [archaeon]